MKLMIDGVWRGDIDPSSEGLSDRVVHSGAFRERVTADGSSRFPPGVGRYHLFVSYACPFAHRVILVRVLKRLEGTVGMSVLHPVWNTSDGWIFKDTTLSNPDLSGAGFTHLHQAYAASQSDYTGKVTVPVLWDGDTRRIVSNESIEIVRMLNGAFDQVGGDPAVDLCPPRQHFAIGALDASIDRDLAGGVYAVGGAHTQAQYDSACDRLFDRLDALETQLGDGRSFLHGEAPTTSDILAFTPLVRFDAIYHPLFRASRKRLIDYPGLAAFARRFLGLPGVADTVRFEHILRHYHDGDWGVAERRGIVPALPAVDFRNIRLA